MITNKLLLGFIIVLLNSIILNINGGCCGKGRPNKQSTQTEQAPDPSKNKGSKRIDPNLGKLKNEIPPKIEEKKIKFLVCMNKPPFDVWSAFRPSDPLYDLKMNIFKKNDSFRIKSQILRRRINGEEINNADNETLNECGIKNGDVLAVTQKETKGKDINILVKNLMGELSPLKTNQDDTIGELKERIKNTGDTSGFDLIFNGKVLDEMKTVDEYKIKGNNTINMIIDKHAYL